MHGCATSRGCRRRQAVKLVAYLNIEVIVEFDSLAKGVHELIHAGELPHVSYLRNE